MWCISFKVIKTRCPSVLVERDLSDEFHRPMFPHFLHKFHTCPPLSLSPTELSAQLTPRVSDGMLEGHNTNSLIVRYCLRIYSQYGQPANVDKLQTVNSRVWVVAPRT